MARLTLALLDARVTALEENFMTLAQQILDGINQVSTKLDTISANTISEADATTIRESLAALVAKATQLAG